MELFVFIRFHALQGQEGVIAAAIGDVLEPSRAEPGCIDIGAFRSTRDPRLFYIHSRWVDEAAFVLHVELPHTVRFLKTVEPLIDHPLEVVRTSRLDAAASELAETAGTGPAADDWRIHWLEAAGDLQNRREQIAHEIEEARKAISRIVRLPRLDILVQQQAGGVIPEIGMVGHAHHHALFSLTIDTFNPNFAGCLADGTLRRQVAHEVHHCLRMGGPGYGRTLGEALVSEGLAGHFVRRVFSSGPEPWECAVDEATLRAHLPDKAALTAVNYDHRAWFFGAGGRLPRWYGYTLGYEIVGTWLHRTTGVDGGLLVNVPAEAVISAAWPG